MILNIATSLYRYENAVRLLTDIQSNNYYFFVGNHQGSTDPADIFDNINDIEIFPYENMVFGKKILSADASLIIKNIPWQSSTVYAMYDDKDQSLSSKLFYVIVNEGSFYHVWKCLDNNNNSPSTAQPSFAAGSNTVLYQTSDGYRWKYMSSTPTATVSKFATSDNFPIIANNNVVGLAFNGSYDIIKVENQGARYSNFIDGTFTSGDIRLSGNTILYNISNTSVQTVSGFYTGCLIYLSGGSGQGQFKTIVDYVSNSTGNIIKLESEFGTPPLNGTTFEIRPQVQVTALDVIPQTNCVARALVNTVNSNSIYRIEVLRKGFGYLSATAQVIANTVVGVSNTALIRPINGPFGGHGFWQYQELYSKDVGVSVSLANTIGGLVPATNHYQQIGILKNPRFANVTFALTSNFGNFANNEVVYQFTSKQIQANVTTTSNSVNVTCLTASWVNQVSANQYLYITTPSGALNQLVQVNSVTNSSQIILKSPALFSCTSVIISTTNLVANAITSSINSSNNINVTNCAANFTAGGRVIGSTSGAIGSLNTFTRNGVAKDFGTFIQLHKYDITLLSGSFTQNELVKQANSTALVFDANSTSLFVSNFTNTAFQVGQVVGGTSLAQANVTQIYAQELVPASGPILYCENISSVPRTTTNTETFQIIFNF